MKTIKEMIGVMQAYERGEQIESICNIKHATWYECNNPIWNWSEFDYRVKPKTKYIPFETAEEFFAAQRKHGCGLITIEDGEKKSHDVSITIDGIVFEHGEDNWACKYLGDLEDLLLEDYKFADGTPCGKEVVSCQQ